MWSIHSVNMQKVGLRPFLASFQNGVGSTKLAPKFASSIALTCQVNREVNK